MSKSSTSNQNQPAGRAKAKAAARARTQATVQASVQPAGASVAPAPVRRAVRFMFAGSVGSLVLGAYLVIVTVAFRSDSLAANNALEGSKRLTASQFNAEFTGVIIFDIVLALVCAALWAWMARMNQAGRNWARIASTVLFLIWTYYTYQTIAGLGTWVILGVLIIELLIWGVGAAALYFLWRPDSTQYFKASAQRA